MVVAVGACAAAGGVDEAGLLAVGIDVDWVEEGTVPGFEGVDDAVGFANTRDGEYG